MAATTETVQTPVMRAKYVVESVSRHRGQYDQPGKWNETIKLSVVTTGTREDNTFHEHTPFGEMDITITNPALHGKIEPGQKYYLDFTLSE